MDQQLKELMKELGVAINESLSHSEQSLKLSPASRRIDTTSPWFSKQPSASARKAKKLRSPALYPDKAVVPTSVFPLVQAAPVLDH